MTLCDGIAYNANTPVSLNRENLGKEISPNGQDEKPDTNHDENDAAPLFDLDHTGPHGANQSFLGRSDRRRQPQRQQGHDAGRHDKSDKTGDRAAGSKGDSGQIGQNRPRSAKAGQQVAKAVQRVARQRRPLL